MKLVFLLLVVNIRQWLYTYYKQIRTSVLTGECTLLVIETTELPLGMRWEIDGVIYVGVKEEKKKEAM